MYNVLLLSVSLLSAVHLTTGAPADLPIAPGNPNYGPANVPLTVTASGATPSETAAPVAEPQQSPVKEVKLSTSKKGVKLGDQEAVKVIETLQDHCGDIDCDQTPYTINARYPDSGGNGLTDGTITVEIQQSSFPSGSVGDLIQALKTFATEASEKTEATYVAGNNCLYSDKLGGRPCDLGEERKIDSWVTSSHFAVRVQDEEGSDKGHMSVEITFQSGADAFMEAFCDAVETGSDIVSNISGSVGSIADGVGTLVTVGCDLFS